MNPEMYCSGTLGTLQPGEKRVVEYSDTIAQSARGGAPLNVDAAVTAAGVSTVQDTLTIIVIN